MTRYQLNKIIEVACRKVSIKSEESVLDYVSEYLEKHFTDEQLKDIGAFYITDLKKKVHEYLRFFATKEFFLTV